MQRSRVRRYRTGANTRRGIGVARVRLRKRWRDDWNYLMASPANRAWIEAAIAELDAWREAWGFPPFGSRNADERAA